MRPFQQLVVWQKAHENTLGVYRISAGFPREEMFGQTSQMRRSSASAPTNIAEGSVHDEGREFHRFLGIALGSAAELEYQLILARDLGYISHEEHAVIDGAVNEVKRMLVRFRARLSAQRNEVISQRPAASSRRPEGAP